MPTKLWLSNIEPWAAAMIEKTPKILKDWCGQISTFWGLNSRKNLLYELYPVQSSSQWYSKGWSNNRWPLSNLIDPSWKHKVGKNSKDERIWAFWHFWRTKTMKWSNLMGLIFINPAVSDMVTALHAVKILWWNLKTCNGCQKLAKKQKRQFSKQFELSGIFRGQ